MTSVALPCLNIWFSPIQDSRLPSARAAPILRGGAGICTCVTLKFYRSIADTLRFLNLTQPFERNNLQLAKGEKVDSHTITLALRIRNTLRLNFAFPVLYRTDLCKYALFVNLRPCLHPRRTPSAPNPVSSRSPHCCSACASMWFAVDCPHRPSAR